MKKNKGDLVTILFACILLLILVGIVVISLKQAPEQSPTNTQPLPTTAVSMTTIVPTQATIYDTNATNKLMNSIKQRIPLSPSDTSAKNTILSKLPNGQPSGVLYTSKTIIIDYTHSANLFQAEILTPNIAQAKADANVWFRGSGMSQKGICDLPLMFYLNDDVRTQLENMHMSFSPLANAC